MGLFDRLKRTLESRAVPPKPEADTMCLLLMDQVLEDVEPAAELLRAAFGPQAVSGIDRSHPRVPAFTVTVDGLEFWCSYLPMPVPREETDIASAAQRNLFLTAEEQRAFCANQSFWVLAQKGGSTSLAQKRRVCWAFSRVCTALLELEGALGVYLNATGLLVTGHNYLFQRGNMEGKRWDNPKYFPVPLWVWIYQDVQEGKPTVQTRGLKEFGLPELGFFTPERPVQDILNDLYTLSCLQITGQARCWDRSLILLGTKRLVCKQSGETLYLTGN